MTDLDLHDVLARATDALDDPSVVGRAAAQARARLARRRAALVVATVATTAAILVVAPRVGTADRTAPSYVTPTPTGQGFFTPTPTPSAPSIEAEIVQAVWDPATVTDMPLAQGVALPDSLDPPLNAPDLETTPIRVAVAAVDTGDLIGLVDADGAWRTLAKPDAGPALAYGRDTIAISPEGTRIAFAGESELWWRDVRGGRWHTVSYPAEMDLAAEGDRPLVFTGTEELQVRGWARSEGARTWAVDLGNGVAEPLPYGLGPTATRYQTTVSLVTIDGRRVLQQYTNNQLSRDYYIDGFHSLLFPALSESSLAVAREVSSYTEPREGAEWDGLLAFDVASGRPHGYLPVEDENAWYSRAGLVPVAWVNDDVVLVRVIPKQSGGLESGTAYLATWDVESGGDLARVSSYDVTNRLVVATDLLADP